MKTKASNLKVGDLVSLKKDNIFSLVVKVETIYPNGLERFEITTEDGKKVRPRGHKQYKVMPKMCVSCKWASDEKTICEYHRAPTVGFATCSDREL